MNEQTKKAIAKVPAATLIFWIIKVAATTLGETGGDAVSMSMNLGYLVGTAIFAVVFLAFVFAQVKAKRFNPVLYWLTIIATTTVGTTMADFADRSLGIGYAGGTTILAVLLLSSLVVWYKTLGTIAIDSIHSTKSEIFYWVTIMFSQTLGTALGDWTADTQGLGYIGGAILFGSMLAVLAVLHFTRKAPTSILFWSAFILTRPLGAVVGDFLDKPIANGGLNLSRYTASAVLMGFIALCIWVFPQKAAMKSKYEPVDDKN